MSRVLIIGASRGLGASLAKLYAADGRNGVYATRREFKGYGPSEFPPIHWLVGIDLLHSNVGDGVIWQLQQFGVTKLDVLVSTLSSTAERIPRVFYFSSATDTWGPR